MYCRRENLLAWLRAPCDQVGHHFVERLMLLAAVDAPGRFACQLVLWPALSVGPGSNVISSVLRHRVPRREGARMTWRAAKLRGEPA